MIEAFNSRFYKNPGSRFPTLHSSNCKCKLIYRQTYKAWGLFAVAWFYFLGLVEQVVRELLLSHVPHGVQVLKEALQNGNKGKT